MTLTHSTHFRKNISSNYSKLLFSFKSPLFINFPRKKLAILCLLALGSSSSALAALYPPSSCAGFLPANQIKYTTGNVDASTIKDGWCYQTPINTAGIGGRVITFTPTLPPNKLTIITHDSNSSIEGTAVLAAYDSNLILNNIDVYTTGNPNIPPINAANFTSGVSSYASSNIEIKGHANIYVADNAMGITGAYGSTVKLNSVTIQSGLKGYGMTFEASELTQLGDLNINTSSTGLRAATSSILDIYQHVDINTTDDDAIGIVSFQSEIKLHGITKVNTSGDNAFGLFISDASDAIIDDDLIINTTGATSHALYVALGSTASLSKSVTVRVGSAFGLISTGNSILNLKSASVHTLDGHAMLAEAGSKINITDAGVLDLINGAAFGLYANGDNVAGGTIDLIGSSPNSSTETGGASIIAVATGVVNFNQYVNAKGSRIILAGGTLNLANDSYDEVDIGSLEWSGTLNLGTKQLNLGVLSGGANDTIIKTETSNGGSINGTGTGTININADPSFRDTYSLTLTGALNWSAPTKVESGTLIFSGAPTGSAISQNLIGTANGTFRLENGSLFKGAILSTAGQFEDAPNMRLGGIQNIWEMPSDSKTNTLTNLGQIKFTNTTPGNTLSVYKDYNGGGELTLNTTINGDSNSPTDRLQITGNVTGTTTVFINNIAGLGEPTTNGILVIAVGGTSAPDAFVLGARVRAGKYEYSLRPHADGNWYLDAHLMLDHYKVEFSDSGLTCNDHEVTITACANKDCSELVLEAMTLTLAPDSTTALDGQWRPYTDCSLSSDPGTCGLYTGIDYFKGLNGTPNPTLLTFDKGIVTLGLAHFAEGTTTIGISSSDYPFRWPTLSTDPNIYNCNPTGNIPGSCDVDFKKGRSWFYKRDL